MRFFIVFIAIVVMDELRAIKYFLKVAETGSFTEAAHYFNVPPSSLSRRVSDLEADLNTTLLHRTTRVVKLTEVGKLYYQQTLDIYQQLHDAKEIVRSHNTEPQGLLRISSLVSFGERRLLPLLDEFNRQYPKVILDVTLSDELAVFSRDEADIAIRGGYAPNERVVAVPLLSNKFYPVASPKYIERYGAPKNIDDWQHHKAICFKGPSGTLPWLMQQQGQWKKVAIEPIAMSNNVPWLVSKAVNAEGILLAPRWCIQPNIESEELVELGIKPELFVRPSSDAGSIYLLYQKQQYQQAKIKAAVDFLTERLKGSL